MDTLLLATGLATGSAGGGADGNGADALACAAAAIASKATLAKACFATGETTAGACGTRSDDSTNGDTFGTDGVPFWAIMVGEVCGALLLSSNEPALGDTTRD